jgi:putative sigma-54 modulation protein
MAALDLAVDRFEKQLRRLRDRMVQRSRQPRQDKSDTPATGDQIEPEIVRVKQFQLKPMTPEEAILQLDMLGHEFFYFRNADTDLDSVLYRRRDGAYGLIEPR